MNFSLVTMLVQSGEAIGTDRLSPGQPGQRSSPLARPVPTFANRQICVLPLQLATKAALWTRNIEQFSGFVAVFQQCLDRASAVLLHHNAR